VVGAVHRVIIFYSPLPRCPPHGSWFVGRSDFAV